ncbi:hypothetical protein [Mesobacillus selenatarsenatis]|uniref:Secreted protein n=1 Tax=Mesobacillus selenatarsenatis (strain DSM 18680 / JCM 14380 / FERM P-15431 / SF-1) TaxID=1321606 RepID=A0A0A8WWF3_MESS1|nr:hypothetical protein [Mesobacillus selenatarsenatis]GAM11955.1 hypothetical protein SAMD00020551_0073 [Mesobacillus selenatarsenatis SF-1]
MNRETEHGSGSHHDHSQQENLTGESSQTGETIRDSNGDHQSHSLQDSHAGHHGHDQLSGELNAAKVQVEWTSNPEPIQSNQETDIFLDIKDASGKAVEIFSAVHEKEMHLLTIKRDLSVFQHLHPDYLGKGRFQIKTTFPKAGRYKLYADFLPEGANQQLASHELVVTGAESNEEIHADKVLKKRVDDLEIELILPEAKVNEHLKMIFALSDRDGSPITELEPYLGSAGHVVIVSEDMEEFLHVHPADENTKGPKVEYMTSFPRKGIYKIWGQFKYKGKLYTAPFVIEVQE